MSPYISATPTAGRITLETGTVHVWSASLDRPPPSQLRRLERLLSPSELARADRLRIDRDRRHFVVRRGLLRSILGRYGDTPAEELVFQYGEYGKPALDPRVNAGALTFNLSYSFGLALYAIGRAQEVGVDVERLRDTVPHSAMAARYFSPAECAELDRLPAGARTEGFFNGWTRKESYVKALGTGLVTRLDSFTVNLAPGEPARLLAAAPSAADRRWTLLGLGTAPGYAAALTVAGDCERVALGEWL